MTSFTTGSEVAFENGIYESIQFRELEKRGEMHFDTRPQPVAGLERRQVGQDSTSSSTSSMSSTSATSTASTISEPTSTTISVPSSSASASSNAAATSSLAASPSTTVVTVPLPSPFDTSIGSNFTSTSCSAFFTTFLQNSTFRSCTPISLLLQNSASFFQVQRSPSLLSSTLDASCAVPISVCTPLMTYLASELLSDANCGHDFSNQQPLVLQAYNGLVAYEPVYRATCLKDSSNNYCYADAVTNTSNAGDAYPYYTAIGINLPATAKPTCSQCLQSTLQVFAEYAVREEQPLSKTYLACAAQVDGGCGGGFADTNVKVGSVNSGLGQQAQTLKSAGVRITRGRQVAACAIAAVIGVVALL